jgi:hypothetical protein
MAWGTRLAQAFGLQHKGIGQELATMRARIDLPLTASILRSIGGKP